MAVNSLYNIVDSYFVAKLSDEAMTGAGTGVSGAESHHIYCRRIRHWDQCLRGVLSGCGR